MKKVFDIFMKSPFGLVYEHRKMVHACVSLLPELMESFIDGRQSDVKTIGKQISDSEHQADLIKNQIREHLPKNIFMPVSREDLLKLLHRQDNIADCCEDVGILLSLRSTPVIDDIKEDVRDFYEHVVNTANESFLVTEKIKDLMESSFSGPSAEEVLTRIENVEEMEWRADKKKYHLLKKMFSFESKIDPVTITMFIKIFDVLSGVAHNSDNSLNALRLMISK